MTAAAPGSLILAEEAEQQQDDAQLALFFGGEALALIDRSKPALYRGAAFSGSAEGIPARRADAGGG
jgi:hypothetical protein